MVGECTLMINNAWNLLQPLGASIWLLPHVHTRTSVFGPYHVAALEVMIKGTLKSPCSRPLGVA